MSLPLTASACIAIASGISPAFAATPDPAARYVELVTAYAAGNRSAALAGVGGLDADAFRSGMELLRGQAQPLLRAAAMLHADRRRLERLSPDAPETEARCESAHAKPAAHAVQLLMLDPAGTDFARRWSIAMTLQDWWDGCVQDALRWIDTAARWFPADPETQLARGTLHETIGALVSRGPRALAIRGSRARQVALAATATATNHLSEALRSLERALAADPALDMARLRQGRVLWRLCKHDAARAALEGVLARSRDDAVLHLAHLFVARVHDDAGRPQEALRAYRAALRLQPTSHPAAMGLADALQLAGQPAEARATVEEALEVSGRRPPPQSFWEYTFGTPGEAAELLDRLRDDVSR